MKKRILQLRLMLDGLALLTKKIKTEKVALGGGMTSSTHTMQIRNSANSILLAKAHLGKLLGEVKSEEFEHPETVAQSEPVPPSVQEIAKACHEANKTYCESIGDMSQKSWEEAEQWQRDSAIKGVEFAIANPNEGPAAQHQAWSETKIAEGWVYGEVKDAEAKTHPCLVPYNELPAEQQEKDAIFQRTVKSFFTAYPNDNTRKTVDDIEPAAEKVEYDELTLPEGYEEFTEVQVIDFLRAKLGDAQDQIMSLKEEKFSMAGNIHSTSAYNHACEARFWLGFELERIREEA